MSLSKKKRKEIASKILKALASKENEIKVSKANLQKMNKIAKKLGVPVEDLIAFAGDVAMRLVKKILK